MKEAKKTEEASAVRARDIRNAYVQRQTICGEARRILLQLEGWLADHTKKMNHQFLLCGRFSSAARRVVQNGGMACLEDDPAVLALQLLAGKPLDDIVLQQQERPRLKGFYKSFRFNEGGPGTVGGEGDLNVLKQWDLHRASVMVLKEAIKKQKNIILEKTAASMETFSKTVSTLRAETVKDLLAALAELKCAAEPDQRLVEGLEPDEIACLRPRPFPSQILSSEAIQFFLDAVEQKMISQAELGALQLETVKSAEPAPELEPERSELQEA